jgi:hypothetical protein
MVLNHIWGLFSQPEREWKAIKKEKCTIARCFCSHVFLLAAIPAVSSYFGTTRIGWQIGIRDPIRLSPDSALIIAVLYYAVMIFAVFIIGKTIHWMGQTYGSKQNLSTAINLAGYSATPLFLIGLMHLVIGLPALAYTVYLFYGGVPVMMGVSKERGFLFASAVMAVGLVMLVGLLASSVILWSFGLGPVFID